MLNKEFQELCRCSDLQTVQAAVNEHGNHLLENKDAFKYALYGSNLPVAKWLYSRDSDLYLKFADTTIKCCFEYSYYRPSSKELVEWLHQIHPMSTKIFITAATGSKGDGVRHCPIMFDWCLQNIKIEELEPKDAHQLIWYMIWWNDDSKLVELLSKILQNFVTDTAKYNSFCISCFESMYGRGEDVFGKYFDLLFSEIFRLGITSNITDSIYTDAFRNRNWTRIELLEGKDQHLSKDFDIEYWIKISIDRSDIKFFNYITALRPNHKLSNYTFTKICRSIKVIDNELNQLVLSWLQHCTTINKKLYLDFSDGKFVRYSTNSYHREIAAVESDNSAAVTKKLGIKTISNTLICEACTEPHCEIILLPCGHAYCLVSLLKSARKFTNGNKCDSCDCFYKWPQCIEIINNKRFGHTKSAK